MTMKRFADKTDRFIRIEPVYNTRSFFIQCNKLKLIADNTPLGWNKYFKKLFAYERENSYNYKKYKTRFCISLKILIPHELEEEHYADFSKCFIDKILQENNALPYAVFYMEEGKGKYLYIALSEREFFEKSKNLKTVAKRTIFRDSISGKICAENHPNAELYRTKGDIIGEKNTNFGLKVKLFHFTTNSAFDRFMNFAKNICMTILETFNVKSEEKVILKKYNYSKLEAFKERKNAKRLNKEIKKIEKQLDDFYSGLYFTKQINEKGSKRLFMDVYLKYQQLINNLKFSYNNRSYEIDLNSSRSFFNSVIELLHRKLEDDLLILSQSIY